MGEEKRTTGLNERSVLIVFKLNLWFVYRQLIFFEIFLLDTRTLD